MLSLFKINRIKSKDFFKFEETSKKFIRICLILKKKKQENLTIKFLYTEFTYKSFIFKENSLNKLKKEEIGANLGFTGFWVQINA